MNLCDIGTIKYIQKKFGFKNSKALGQNFLTRDEVIREMVDAADIEKGDLVIEIGPGIGVLTYAIAQMGARVVALELDRNLLPVLDYTLGEYPEVEIVNEDVLKMNLKKLIEEKGESKAKIMGNLPYYITTPIITHILEEAVPAETIIVMMQKEVADRIMAEPGSKTFGALSVVVQYYCGVEKVTDVGKECFFPSPKVDSTVLKLTPLEEPRVKVKSRDMFFRCVKAGFGQRRKTLLNSLGATGFSRDIIKDCLEAVSVDPQRRAETLSLEEFALISDYFTTQEGK